VAETTVAEFARRPPPDLAREVRRLCDLKRAVILAHNYQVAEVQEVADHLGDSLQLAELARATDAELIVLCGVRFMAETAKLLNPDRKVIIPSLAAGCPMADTISAEDLRAFKAQHPGLPVVCYVNTTAEVKAGSDVCCTSANAVDVVAAVPGDTVLFVPDRNLAAYAAAKTGKHVIAWEGHCYVHSMFVREDVELARAEHPGVPVVVHPECAPDVIGAADFVVSTSGMVRLAKEHDRLVIGTEVGLIDLLNREHPSKQFFPLSAFATCRGMKATNLPRLAWALTEERYEVSVPADVIDGARRALERMLELTGGRGRPGAVPETRRRG